MQGEMEAVIFIGPQGAGKTTFYRQRFFETHVRISLDMLHTRRRERLLLAACLEAGQPFVVDNTNPLAHDRARYISAARAAGFRAVAYFFETTLEEVLRRNNQRTDKQRIPPVAVVATFKKLERPSAAEGFQQIFTVRLTGDYKFESKEDNCGGQGRKQG
jgi:predicted kinase